MFTRTYCLYLPEREERIKNEFGKFDITVDYVRGKDARLKEAVKNGVLRSGEMACLLGHIEILKRFLADAGNPRWAIVGEDDIDILRHPENSLMGFLEQVGQPDVILLNDAEQFRDGYSPVNNALDVSYVYCPSWGTQMYAISRDGARQYIEYATEFRFKADQIWRDPRRFYRGVAQVKPGLACARENRSLGSVIDEAEARG